MGRFNKNINALPFVTLRRLSGNMIIYIVLVSIIFFADDTNMYHSYTCLKTLNDIMQIEMNKIADWLIANKLSINIKKSKFILFKSPKKRLNHSV